MALAAAQRGVAAAGYVAICRDRSWMPACCRTAPAQQRGRFPYILQLLCQVLTGFSNNSVLALFRPGGFRPLATLKRVPALSLLHSASHWSPNNNKVTDFLNLWWRIKVVITQSDEHQQQAASARTKSSTDTKPHRQNRGRTAR
jgi:hypothetical protein